MNTKKSAHPSPAKPLPSADASDEALHQQRQQINQIDLQILTLMNQRIGIAQSIGKIKAALAEPAFYRPEREAQVLARLRAANRGPLSARGLESLFREIMSLTRGSEAGLSAAILGPLGTYSEAATRQHFGSAMQLVPYETVGDACKAAETGQTNFSVLPVENSTEGGVGESLDRLITTSLSVCGEINFKVVHNLLTRATALDAIEYVIAHPQSLAQCRHWLDKNLPTVSRRPASSNADAALQATQNPQAAAIAGVAAAQRYELPLLVENIEDTTDNTTRFLVLSTRETPPSGDDKTSLLLSAHNRPGALLHLLQPLLEQQVDMTRLESRPSKTGLWEYVFFIDIIGHQHEPHIAAALTKLKSEAGLFKVLGSYPRSPLS